MDRGYRLDPNSLFLHMNTNKKDTMEKNKDPFGFNKAINWDKLNDPKVLKELEKMFNKEEEEEDEETNGQ